MSAHTPVQSQLFSLIAKGSILGAQALYRSQSDFSSSHLPDAGLSLDASTRGELLKGLRHSENWRQESCSAAVFWLQKGKRQLSVREVLPVLKAMVYTCLQTKPALELAEHLLAHNAYNKALLKVYASAAYFLASYSSSSPQEAVEILRKAIAAFPSAKDAAVADLHPVLAEKLGELGDRNAALEVLAEWRGLRPGLHSDYHTAVVMIRTLNMAEEGLPLLRSYRAATRKRYHAYEGCLFLQAKAYAEAEECFSQAKEKTAGRPDPGHYLGLAAAQYHASKKEEAFSTLQQGLIACKDWEGAGYTFIGSIPEQGNTMQEMECSEFLLHLEPLLRQVPEKVQEIYEEALTFQPSREPASLRPHKDQLCALLAKGQVSEALALYVEDRELTATLLPHERASFVALTRMSALKELVSPPDPATNSSIALQFLEADDSGRIWDKDEILQAVTEMFLDLDAAEFLLLMLHKMLLRYPDDHAVQIAFAEAVCVLVDRDRLCGLHPRASIDVLRSGIANFSRVEDAAGTELYPKLAEHLSRCGELEAALSVYTQWRNLNPDLKTNRSSGDIRIRVIYRPELGLPTLRAYRETCARSYDAFEGCLFLYAQAFEEAAELFSRAITETADKPDPGLFLGLAGAQYHAGDKDEAFSSLQRGLIACKDWEPTSYTFIGSIPEACSAEQKIECEQFFIDLKRVLQQVPDTIQQMYRDALTNA